ncbi:MAG: hypothetical protein J6M62_08875 [Selenomonadaceae bacterium]|nr:hypothetical protein [Selenomonadaceae bacterium]MBO6305171.1 hypothetical protein [Selenomonadaceae bacterium]
MQAIELPTSEQKKRIKELIAKLGKFVRTYAIDDLSKEEAEELLAKLEIIDVYSQLPKTHKNFAYEFMEWLQGGTPPLR